MAQRQIAQRPNPEYAAGSHLGQAVQVASRSATAVSDASVKPARAHVMAALVAAMSDAL